MDNATVTEKLNQWLGLDDLDGVLRKELEALRDGMAAGDERVIADAQDRFYRDLEFGTGGMRGVLGAGTNRMNVYTVRRITQGFADHINAHRAPGAQAPTAAVGYDNRINSDLFAFETACVFLANGIGVHIYPMLMPTPALSFAVRYCGAAGGVMITASHNAKEYNGYKIYDAAGGQSLLEEADAVARRIDETDLFGGVKTVAGRFRGSFSEKLAEAAGLSFDGGARLRVLPDDVREAFVSAVLERSMGGGAGSGVSIVFTPLHGTGNLPVREALRRAGFDAVHTVAEQESYDGNFPTCPYPNPEKAEALTLGLALCDRLRAGGTAPDILLATDPDCDRVGVAVLHDGAYVQLTGNEVGILLLDFVCRARRAAGTLPERPVAVKTIVSSPLATRVADGFGVEMINVLTGFKFIGEQISMLAARGEADRYIFGFEESCGYMSGDHVRDKDAVNACLLVAELAAACKRNGETIIDRMNAIYAEHGFFINENMEFTMAGAAGMARIGRVMKHLRETDPAAIFTKGTAEVADYLTSEKRAGGETREIDLPKSDVLEFVFEDGSSVIARPSGTEPKLKLYLAVLGKTEDAARRAKEALRDELTRIIDGIA